MARRTHDYDWAALSLHESDTRPQVLSSTVDLLIAHGLSMVVLWGPNLLQIYNDGCHIIMADKHPTGLDQPTREC